jgi:hypothetical protein
MLTRFLHGSKNASDLLKSVSAVHTQWRCYASLLPETDTFAHTPTPTPPHDSVCPRHVAQTAQKITPKVKFPEESTTPLFRPQPMHRLRAASWLSRLEPRWPQHDHHTGLHHWSPTFPPTVQHCMVCSQCSCRSTHKRTTFHHSLLSLTTGRRRWRAVGVSAAVDAVHSTVTPPHTAHSVGAAAWNAGRLRVPHPLTHGAERHTECRCGNGRRQDKLKR